MQCDVLKCEYNSWTGTQERHEEYTCKARGQKVLRAAMSEQYGEIRTDRNVFQTSRNGFPILVCQNFKARLPEGVKNGRTRNR